MWNKIRIWIVMTQTSSGLPQSETR